MRRKLRLTSNLTYVLALLGTLFVCSSAPEAAAAFLQKIPSI